MTRPDQRPPAARRLLWEARKKRIFEGVVASYIREISERPTMASVGDRRLPV